MVHRLLDVVVDIKMRENCMGKLHTFKFLNPSVKRYQEAVKLKGKEKEWILEEQKVILRNHKSRK